VDDENAAEERSNPVEKKKYSLCFAQIGPPIAAAPLLE